MDVKWLKGREGDRLSAFSNIFAAGVPPDWNFI
jgi:hypothetical protein